MEESRSVLEEVFIKQEPEDDSEDEASHLAHVMMLKEKIKVEIEYERVEPGCVKHEPSCEDSRAGSEAEAGQNEPKSERVQPAEAPSQAAIAEVAPATQHTQDCPDDAGATGSTGTRAAETNPYTCDKCGKKFKEIYFYIPHMRLHEHNTEVVEESVSKQTQFRCDICYKVYSSKSGLYRHQQTDNCARFSCRYCEKQFKMYCNLQKHERIHTKPYSCDICKKRFAGTFSLMTHKRIHTGEKPYGCEQCERKFRVLGELTKHKRIHTGEKPCRKQFGDVASLIVYKRVHIGEKPFSCEVCDKKFTSNSSLITHRRQHVACVAEIYS